MIDDNDNAAAPRSYASRLLTGTLWSMVGLAALGVTRLVYTALIGRTGSPERLAEVNAQVSLAFIATFVSAAATGTAAAKFIPLAAARSGRPAAAAVSRRLGWWTVLATVVVLGVLAAFGGSFLPSAGWAEVGWVCALAAAYGAYTFAKQVLYGWQQPGRYAVLEVFADLAIVVLTVVAVVAGSSRWLIAPLVVGYAGFAVAALVSAPRVAPGPMPDLGRNELGGFVAYTTLGIAASQGFFQASMVVAPHATSSAEAGLYAAAMSLITPAFFAPRALALAFLPSAAEASGRGDQAALARQTDLLTRMLALSMLPLFAVAAMLGAPALWLVFGPDYTGGGAVLAVLLLGVLLYVVAVPAVNVLTASDLASVRVPPLASAAGLVVGVAVWLLVGGRAGAVGIGLGYLAGMVVQAGIPLVIAFRRLEIRWGAGLVVRLACSLAVAAGLGTVAVVRPQPLVVTGCLVAFAIAFALLHGRELLGLVRQVHAARPVRTR